MKRLIIVGLAVLFTIPAFSAGKMKTYNKAYIWAHSNRNHSDRGSALSTSNGKTYSMKNVVRKTKSNAIDIMLFYGRPSGRSSELGLRLFAPNNPYLRSIDWDKDFGTMPFRFFYGISEDPEGPSWLKNWDIRNDTRMHKIENVDFDKATVETIDTMEVRESYMTGVLKTGDVVLFKTSPTSTNPNKKGLIQIGKIEDDKRPDKAGQGSFQKVNLRIKIID